MTALHLASLAFFAVCGGIAMGSIVNDFRAAALILDRKEVRCGRL